MNRYPHTPSPISNIVSLYGIHLTNYLLPVVTIAYLARVLGSEVWALLVIAEAVGRYFTTLIEYGFSLSAARLLAEGTERSRVSVVVADVLGAKMVLAGLAFGMGVVAFTLLPWLREDPWLFWSGCYWGTAAGLTMSWYYQTTEHLQRYALAEGAGKVAAVIGIVLCVRASSDAWLAFAIQGSVALLIAAGAHWHVAKKHGFTFPKPQGIRRVLSDGALIFVSRGGISLYRVGNAFVLSLLLAPAGVAAFAAAEKVGRAVGWLVTPYAQALYPRVVATYAESAAEASALVKRTTLHGTGIGIGLALMTAVLAEPITSAMYGDEFSDAVPLLQVFALLPVLVAIGNSLAMHWLLPRRMDRHFGAGYAVGGIFNIAAALLLVPRTGAAGMVWSVLMAEAVVVLFFGGVIAAARVRRNRELQPAGSSW